MTKIIAFAIPFFFFLIGVEFFLSRRWGRSDYRFNDAITDLGCGIGEQVTGIYLGFLTLIISVYCYEHFALFEFSAASPLTWIIAFVGVDLGYYVWHRLSHRVNFIWAAHIVHHQSQDYNLAVALRQAWFTGLSSFIFYLPLFFLGVPPAVILTMRAFSLLYQFWIHTRLIAKLGPFETFFNTPSHHRVHHGINPEYVDKNYGATLIIWDRLFGTFEPEVAEPVYGTVQPYNSWNSIGAQFHYYGTIGRLARQLRTPWEKLKVWFMPPKWRPDYLGGNMPTPKVYAGDFKKFETPVSFGVRLYIGVNFILGAAATTLLLFKQNELSELRKLLLVVSILFTLLVFGALFEGKRWAGAAETARLALVALLLGAVFMRWV